MGCARLEFPTKKGLCSQSRPQGSYGKHRVSSIVTESSGSYWRRPGQDCMVKAEIRVLLAAAASRIWGFHSKNRRSDTQQRSKGFYSETKESRVRVLKSPGWLLELPLKGPGRKKLVSRGRVLVVLYSDRILINL